eukprot:scaffold160928_cov29-Attheya_sp.AAC.4
MEEETGTQQDLDRVQDPFLQGNHKEQKTQWHFKRNWHHKSLNKSQPITKTPKPLYSSNLNRHKPLTP